MAAEKESTGIGRSRAALLALLIIAGVAGAIHFAGRSGDAPPAAREYVDDDVVEVAPLVPANRMSGASWHSAEQARDDGAAEDEQAGGGESVLDKVEWGEDEARRGYDKSVEETVKEIDGLGVYIAPAGDQKKPAEQPKKAPAKPAKKDGAK